MNLNTFAVRFFSGKAIEACVEQKEYIKKEWLELCVKFDNDFKKIQTFLCYHQISYIFCILHHLVIYFEFIYFN